MSRLIASIACPGISDMVARGQSALAGGANLVELRLDALARKDQARFDDSVSGLPSSRWIATLRSRAEGGEADQNPSERRAILLAAAKAGAGFVDLELRDRESGPWDADLPPQVGIIASHHDLGGMPADPDAVFEQLAKFRGRRHGATKLAWTCRAADENLRALDLMRAALNERIVIPMGEKGALARVLARKCGGFGTFCALSPADATAAGQFTLRAMIDELAWPTQDADTEIFGVIGNPVGHSLSPAIFNAQFRGSGRNAVYLPVRIEGEEEFRAFLEGCQARSWLNARGFSVTVPHKEAALRAAGEQVDEVAQRIGAANTLEVSKRGLRGHNTDCLAALAALNAGLGLDEKKLHGLTVAVLGAGGVARAVVAGLVNSGARVTMFNRTAERARGLAQEFDCHTGDWADRHRHGAQLLLNCTSVGMSPEVDASPMPADGLHAGMAVFDTVYNPRETMLLRLARKAGCRTLDGVPMFVEQAAAQYRIWTGSEPDIELMTRIVTDRLA